MPDLTGNELQFECTGCDLDFFLEDLKAINDDQSGDDILLCRSCIKGRASV